MTEAQQEGAHAILDVAKELLRDGKITESLAERIVGVTLGSHPEAWRVIGITPNALETYQLADNKMPREKGKRVERAHFFDRKKVIRHLLSEHGGNGAMMFDFWRERDMTVLCLSSENGRIRDLEWFPVEPHMHGRFFSNRSTAFALRAKVELPFLRKLFAESSAGKVRLQSYADLNLHHLEFA